MQKILITILLLSSIKCYSQEVLINENIIRWALEKNEKVKIYSRWIQTKDSIIVKQDSLISFLEKKDTINNLIIINQEKTIKNDSLLHISHKEEIDSLGKDLKIANKKITILEVLLIAVAILALL